MSSTKGKIFVVNSDDSLTELTQHEYSAEKFLEGLLERHPALLGGDQIDSEVPRQFFLVDPQIGVPELLDGGDRWSLDLLFLDQAARPTFVEVKKAANLELRRKVVAQMLDYVANATVNWSDGLMRLKHQEACAKRDQDPVEHIRSVLGSEVDVERFWELADQNLRDGRIRMLFVADEIPASLLRIVEFLNSQMERADVLAVEVRQFIGTSQGQELRTLVPRVLGQTEAAKEKKSPRTQSGERLPVLEPEQFIDVLPIQAQGPFRAALEMGKDIGFQLRPYSTAGSQQIQFIVPGVPGSPVYLYSDGRKHFVLYVSLGRYHSKLREVDVNQRLRNMMTTMVPSRRGEIEVKVELGLQAQEIADSNAYSELRSILSLIFETLYSS
jgi:hypothetical protein